MIQLPADSLVYAVTTSIDAADAAELTNWMQQTHVPDVLATGCFTGALLSVIHAPDVPAHSSVNVQYFCATHADLERYLREHAPRLREHTAARYGNRIHAVRTQLDVKASWWQLTGNS